MKQSMNYPYLLATVLSATAAVCHAEIRYVRANALPGGSGQTWGLAFTQVSQALAVAGPGDEIWVANGTYNAIVLVNGVGVYGGFAGNETSRNQRQPGTYVSILDGGTMASHVVLATNMSSQTILDGFTIQRGTSHGGNPGGPEGFGGQGTGGGGIAIVGGAPQIGHCVITNNMADAIRGQTFSNSSYEGFGGGIYIYGEAQPVISSCVISNNSGTIGDGYAYVYSPARGGGVASINSSPRFVDCTFSGNSAGKGWQWEHISGSFYVNGGPGAEGGGAYVLGGSATFQGCTFSANVSGLPGEGMNIATAQGGLPVPGNAGRGGALYASSASIVLVRCTFAGNSTPNGLTGTSNAGSYSYSSGTAGGSGGAVYVDGAGTTNIVNCLFAGNTCGNGGKGAGPIAGHGQAGDGGAGGSGGAIVVTHPANTVRVMNCVFTGNRSGNGGLSGGIDLSFPPTGPLVDGVKGADGAGGGVALLGGATATISNCTIHANTSSNVAGGVSGNAVIQNCILWNNTGLNGGDQNAQSDSTQIQYSCVSAYTGTPAGNIGANPLFVDADGADNVAGTADDDLRLQHRSPAIDAGNSSLLPLDVADLDGDMNTTEVLPLDLALQPRVADILGAPGAGVDMGAYEAQPIVCPADLDDGSGNGTLDGGVDINDLLFFLTAFEAGSGAADLDNDGDPAQGVPDGGVDINDLLFFLAHFEAGC